MQVRGFRLGGPFLGRVELHVHQRPVVFRDVVTEVIFVVRLDSALDLEAGHSQSWIRTLTREEVRIVRQFILKRDAGQRQYLMQG